MAGALRGRVPHTILGYANERISYAYHISKRRIFYADSENMQFNEIERNFNSQNLNSNLQRDRLKNTKGNVVSWFFAFYTAKLVEISKTIFIAEFV